MLTLGDDVHDKGSAHSARVKLDALKWYIAKRNPDKYADRLDQRVKVETIDMTSIVQAARLRAEQARLQLGVARVTPIGLDELL